MTRAVQYSQSVGIEFVTEFAEQDIVWTASVYGSDCFTKREWLANEIAINPKFWNLRPGDHGLIKIERMFAFK